MEDSELLEIAAKSAGIDGDYSKRANAIVHADGYWNPLADDGDALRLAAKLNLSIITSWGFDGNPSGSVGAMLGSSEDLRLTSTKYGDEPCAAWRRAIVLAAAEIGKSMP